MTIFFLVLVMLLLAFVSGLLGAAIRTQSSLQQIILNLAHATRDTNTIHGVKVMKMEAWMDIRFYLGCLV